MVTAGTDGTARIWTADLGPDAAARLGSWPAARGAEVSPDGRALVELPAGRLWDLPAGREVATLSGHKGEVSHAAFSADGSKVLTVSPDHKVRLWEPRTGNPLAVLDGHTAAVRSAEWNPAGTRIVTAARDGTARVWDAGTGRELIRLEQTARTKTGGAMDGVDQFVRGTSFSPDGRRVVGSPEGSATWAAAIWDAETGKELQAFQFTNSSTWNNPYARFLPDGRILTASPAGVWGVGATRPEVRFSDEKLHADPSVVGGRRFVAAAAVVQPRRGPGRSADRPDGPHPGGAEDSVTAWPSAGPGTCWSVRRGTAARVWDVATGHELLALPTRATAVRFHGRRVVTAGRGSTWPVDPLAAARRRRPRADGGGAQKFGLEP